MGISLHFNETKLRLGWLAGAELLSMSNSNPDAAKTKQPRCPDCGHGLDKKNICWNCYDRENEQSPDEPDEPDFKSYRGGRWIVDRLMGVGDSESDAIAEAQHPDAIRMRLSWGFDGFAEILADRYASEGLRQLLIAKDPSVLAHLARCIELLRNPQKGTKRGPRPKAAGVHLEEQVLRLKRAGKSYRQIAKLLGMIENNVGAAYSNITNKIAKQQIQERANISRR